MQVSWKKKEETTTPPEKKQKQKKNKKKTKKKTWNSVPKVNGVILCHKLQKDFRQRGAIRSHDLKKSQVRAFHTKFVKH